MRRLLMVILLCALGIISPGVPAHAISSGTKQFISADNTFYAYVKGGETISAIFARVNFDEQFDTVRGDVIVTIEGPGVAQQRCVMAKSIPIGQGCNFKAQTAPESGIWRIQFIAPEGAKTYKEVSPVVRWGKNWFNWNIIVAGNGVEQRGRVWTERYAIRQPSPASYLDDFVNYYISEDGYIYKATMFGYNGQISTLSADGIGIRSGSGCVSVYRSVDVGSDQYSPALGTCGSGYKLFFEEPAGELPTKARRWDKETEWIRPNISRPEISNLKFTSDQSNDQLSGTVSFNLNNFIGQYQIKIDVDDDGSFDGQSDVTLNQQMKQLTTEKQKVRFDGVDKYSQIISPTARIGIKVVITKVAEIHLVAADVEGRTGGLELIRLSGDNAPTTRMCWNDTELASLADVTFITEKINGQDCPDSMGGVHSWKYTNASWGNARYVDDWIYASAKLKGNNQIAYPETSEGPIKSLQSNWLLISGMVITVIVVNTGLVILYVRLHSKRPPQTPLPPQQSMDAGGQPPNLDADRY